MNDEVLGIYVLQEGSKCTVVIADWSVCVQQENVLQLRMVDVKGRVSSLDLESFYMEMFLLALALVCLRSLLSIVFHHKDVDNVTHFSHLSSGPTIGVVNEFWRLIWDNDVAAIVMVTNVIERGKVSIKASCLQHKPPYGRISVESNKKQA